MTPTVLKANGMNQLKHALAVLILLSLPLAAEADAQGCGITPLGVGLGGANTGTLSSSSTPNVGASVQLLLNDFFAPDEGQLASGVVVLATQTAATPFLGGTLLGSVPAKKGALPLVALLLVSSMVLFWFASVYFDRQAAGFGRSAAVIDHWASLSGR